MPTVQVHMPHSHRHRVTDSFEHGDRNQNRASADGEPAIKNLRIAPDPTTTNCMRTHPGDIPSTISAISVAISNSWMQQRRRHPSSQCHSLTTPTKQHHPPANTIMSSLSPSPSPSSLPFVHNTSSATSNRWRTATGRVAVLLSIALVSVSLRFQEVDVFRRMEEYAGEHMNYSSFYGSDSHNAMSSWTHYYMSNNNKSKTKEFVLDEKEMAVWHKTVMSKIAAKAEAATAAVPPEEDDGTKPPVEKHGSNGNKKDPLPTKRTKKELTTPTVPDDSADGVSHVTTKKSDSTATTETTHPAPSFVPAIHTTTGQAAATDNISNMFVVVADVRSGSDWLLQSLDRWPNVCASGDFPTAALFPTVMPWLGAGSKEVGCTVAFVRDTLQSDEWNTNSNTKNNERLAQCRDDYDASQNELAMHVPHLCQWVDRLQGDHSTATIAKLFVEDGIQTTDGSNNYGLTGCTCPASSKTRGFKIMADWLDGDTTLPYDETALVGRKVIRLTRRNLFERYMSFVTAAQTNHWSVQSAKDKAEQIDKFQKLSFAIDVDEMLFTFRMMQERDATTNAWANANGVDILWVDYEQMRDDRDETVSKILDFLGADQNENDTDSIGRRLNTNDSGSRDEYHGKILLDMIANREQVQEALGAHGFGDFVNFYDYHPVQHLVYTSGQSQTLLRDANEYKGLTVTPIHLDSRESQPQGSGAIFLAALPVLKQMNGNSLVALSDADAVELNHHIRSLSTFYGELGKLRVTINDMTKDGAVVISTSRECCTKAMSAVRPGSLFGSLGERTLRTCTGDDCAENSNDESDEWKIFMQQVAYDKSVSSGFIYADGSLVAGKASNLIRFIETLSLEPQEDVNAVISDYVHRFHDNVVLDYDNKLSSRQFEGVVEKMENSCIPESESHAIATTTSPLFLQSSFVAQTCSDENKRNKFSTWNEDGVAVQPILEHVNRLAFDNVSANGVDRHFGKEILYMIDKDGIRGTDGKRDKYRVKPTEQFLAMAHEALMESDPKSPRWRSLRKAVDSHGLMYWGYYGDWKECSYKNTEGGSVPLFTTCATASCKHSFPAPSYMTIIDSQPDTTHWFDMFHRFDTDYPVESKIRKVVWRGGLSENDPTKVFDSARYRLCKQIAQLSDGKQKEMFDVGLTNIPGFLTNQIDIDASVVGGLVPGIGAMNDFQRYTAILDMDGNSWSSRFGTMLCYNSVAIKVAPLYTDYFFNDLVPWKHYVPVKNDLSDLLETVEFVLDPTNDELMREIVSSANQWCAQRLTKTELVRDQLDVWEEYAQMLEQADPDWGVQWAQKKAEIEALESKIELTTLSSAPVIEMADDE